MRKSDQAFTQSANQVARACQCDVTTVRSYANAGLVEVYRLDNGNMLFRLDAAKQVTKLIAERSRGRAKRMAAA